MDSNQYFGYGATGLGFGHSLYPYMESLSFDSGNSPNSPFVAHFDPQTPTSLCDSQEPQSSTDTTISLPDCCFQPCSSPFGCPPQTLLIPSVETPFHNLNQTNKRSLCDEASDPSLSIQAVKRCRTVHGFPLLGCDIKQILIACARALVIGNKDLFGKLVEEARVLVSINGDPNQRLGAYVIEGLVARKQASGANICRALRGKEASFIGLYQTCPYLKFGYMAANGAIADACRDEDRIHIIDFRIAQGTQWLTLLQALAARPGGPPSIRITGIDDPVSKHGLSAVGARLEAISEKFNIPVEFHAVVPALASGAITRDMLDIRPGEAVAVNFPFRLRRTPDESVDVRNPRDGVLRLVKSISPKVVTLVEQESNTNTAPFFPRFLETLDYYGAVFESMDASLARDKERVGVEQHCVAGDIVNVIACEGEERVERPEPLGKWKSRFTMAGFREYPLNGYVNSVIAALLKRYSEHYTVSERDGAMLLGWKQRNLISVSAWH
ncbi:hypothetical protein DM860_008682 [Cuscuta australis]|uniref:Uncharacterized protein n=1 Tax=Cuscuta australis TaxID=267555 RepID=A0A328D6D5_9ASTE|nr:hypothetical protein DM860_008682 [Cuscuta australis]